MAINKCTPITVLTIEKDNSMSQAYEISYSDADGFPAYIYYYRDVKSAIPFVGLLRTALNSFRNLRKCIRTIRESRGEFDLVHLNVCYSLGLFAMYLKFIQGKRYVYTEHSSLFLNDNFKRSPWHKRFLIRLILRYASRMSTVSDYLGRSIARLGVKREYTVIPNIVPTDLFTMEENEHSKNDVPCFIHVSNLVRLKGCESMLMACKRLVDRHVSFRFVVIGGTGQELSNLLKLAADLGLEQYVEIKGEMDARTVAAYMRRADFFLMNSEFETFCLSMMEAMACGLPVIAPDNTVFSETISHERGLLMKDRSPQSLELAIGQMIETFNQYDRRNIRAYVMNKFTEEIVGKKFLEFYRSAGS